MYSIVYVISANYDGSLEKITDENRDEVRPIDPDKYFIAQQFKHMYTFSNNKPKYDHQAEIAKYKAKMDRLLYGTKNGQTDSSTPINKTADKNDSTDTLLRLGFSPIGHSPTLSLNATNTSPGVDSVTLFGRESRDPLDSILIEDEDLHDSEENQNVSNRYGNIKIGIQYKSNAHLCVV